MALATSTLRYTRRLAPSPHWLSSSSRVRLSHDDDVDLAPHLRRCVRSLHDASFSASDTHTASATPSSSQPYQPAPRHSHSHPEDPRSPFLYATHVPTTPLQKLGLTVGAAVGALARPARADLVAALGETTGVEALRRMRQTMLADETGRELLRERPRITADSVAPLYDLPPHTFGGRYAQFMWIFGSSARKQGVRGFSADDRPPVRFVDDPELAYVAARYREVHDFWHVLFGLNTTVLGEAALKALEFVHTGQPMCGLAALAGSIRLQGERRALLHSVYLPWALNAGMRCAPLLCLKYEDHFHEDLHELQARWRIVTAPPIPATAGRENKNT